MKIHLHLLDGCAPSPLAHYLKALGILRLVTEQADPEARGAWRDERFLLYTRLDRAELERFFLESYRPTPLLSPWNKGSGLLAREVPAVGTLERGSAPRFEGYRQVLREARALNETVGITDVAAAIKRIKDEANLVRDPREKRRIRTSADYKERLAAATRHFDELKRVVLIPASRRSWRGPHLDWLESAVVLTAAAKPTYPALLGSGGNDGNLDMASNAMQRLAELFELDHPAGVPREGTAEGLRVALWAGADRVCARRNVGQLLPGSAGGANSTNGPSGESFVNGWDFLLALEGAVAFRGGTTRRLSVDASPALGSAPFAVYGHAAGYGSASFSDEAGRGEQWMPLWTRPASFPELRQLLAEGRAQTGRAAARRPLDLVRAVTRLGVARGLSSFVRYGYIERNGQANLAVSLGRVRVGDHPRARLVDDLAPWLDRLHRHARDKHAPTRLQAAERQLSNAVFECLSRPDEARCWQGILLAAADVESFLVPGSSPLAGPIPRLQPAWIDAADDGSIEHRLAVALGTARAGDRPSGHGVDPVRTHFVPLDEKGKLLTTGERRTSRVASSPRLLPAGAAPVEALLALVERRLVEAGRGASRRLPLVAPPRSGASLQDLAAFLDGAADDAKVLRLARAFAAVRPGGAVRFAPTSGGVPEEAWLVLRLAHMPGPLADGRVVPSDPAIVRRLRSGDATGALALALRRLRAAGFAVPIRCGTADPSRARRWGAALAFPLSRIALARALTTLQPPEGDRR